MSTRLDKFEHLIRRGGANYCTLSSRRTYLYISKPVGNEEGHGILILCPKSVWRIDREKEGRGGRGGISNMKQIVFLSVHRSFLERRNLLSGNGML
jgi:hypothetical protein